MNCEELFVVEWSLAQRVFRIQSLQKMLKTNLGAFKVFGSTEYIPIAFCDSLSAAESERDRFELEVINKMHGGVSSRLLARSARGVSSKRAF